MRFPRLHGKNSQTEFCTLTHSADIIYHKTQAMARAKCEKYGKYGKNDKIISVI